MPVLLDDAPLTLQVPTMAGALAAARAAAESRRRVITDILLDGQPVPDSVLGTDGSHPPLSPAANLRFVTADPVELFQHSLIDAAAALETVDQHQQAGARAIQTGRFDRAMPSLSETFTIWETARKTVTDGCSLLGLDPERLVIEAGDSAVPLAGAVRMLLSRLTEIKRCLTAQDWCGLSDVLAYDLPADAELWQALLRGLAAKLPELR